MSQDSPDSIVTQSLNAALRDQMQRQERLRDAQVFLTSPLFVDLGTAPVSVSEDAAALAEHHRDLVYRIGVLESVLALMVEECEILERVMAQEPDPDLIEGLGIAPEPEAAGASGNGPGNGQDTGAESETAG